MWLYIVAGVLGLLVLGLVWGWLHLRNSQKRAYEAMANVRLEEIPALAQACIDGFKNHFDETLALDRFEDTAQIFSSRLDQHETLKKAFAEDDFYWKFVLPTGAFLGEMLRRHAGGKWLASDDGGSPLMKIPVGDGVATTYPFDKIMKHVTSGDPGDLYAFLKTSLTLEKALADSGATR
jgi:hypothetical protein